ncbi:MAG: zinc ABC transporter substrate-binding protein [Deltaproteobacteria bacterium]|nr:zinc ABC transporter substrate-binding protein [Deltaproteobacteria bacterium]
MKPLVIFIALGIALGIALALAACGKADPPAPAPAPATDAGPLRIGVTLHPYYAWTANVIAGVPGMEVTNVLPGEVDAGSYQPSPGDIAKIAKLDVLVVNGIGHDDFIGDMVKSSGNTRLVTIAVNEGTPLLAGGHGEAKNSHTFISFTNAIQQTRLIARRLGELRPQHADKLRANAAAYADRLRGLLGTASQQLAKAKVKKVVTVHDGYAYLLQELGITLGGVVQPSHGLIPSAKELGEMIDLMKKEAVTVVLTEEDFPDKLLAPLREATAARVYVIGHVATGAYTPQKFEVEMRTNADTLVKALVTDPE